jgi:hypothetical protein
MTTSPILQSIEAPNTGKKAVASLAQAFGQRTTQGSTIAVAGVYSHDVTRKGVMGDSGSNVYIPCTWEADATWNGDEWLETFACPGAAPAQTLIYSNVWTDYVGFLAVEIAGPAALAGFRSKWTRDVNGAARISTGPIKLATGGQILTVAWAMNTTENGTGALMPSVFTGVENPGGDWFAYDQKGGAKIATWGWGIATRAPGQYTVEFLAPAGADGDSFLCAGLAFVL